MIRFLIRTAIFLAAAAIGLLIAKVVLDDMTIDTSSFIIVVVIFAVLQALFAPFFARASARGAPALLGGVGLISTFVALLITDLVSDGMSIIGVDTWIFATLIVWIVTMLASFLLPLFVGKRVVENRRD